MVISVQFKDRNKIFKGKTYDYRLAAGEETPKKDSIIRMMDEHYDFIAYGTRVKVTNVRKDEPSDLSNLSAIRFIYDTLD